MACGAAAVEAAQAFTADLFLLGVTGIHSEAGPHHRRCRRGRDEAGAVPPGGRDLRAGSAEKIGAASQFSVLPLSEVTAVITDAEPGGRAVRDLADAGVELLHA